jgi:hypothetical protein
MVKTKPQQNSKSARENVILVAELVYAILKDNDIPVCAIGSTAIVCSTTRSFGREPNVWQYLSYDRMP